jgi:hypothetical protein
VIILDFNGTLYVWSPIKSAELLPENAPTSANEFNGKAGIVNSFNF